MLKIFFPAGLEIATTETHVEYQKLFDLLKDKKHISQEERTSILLISRIFSLMNIECEAIEKRGVQVDFESGSLDYDLVQFSTYVRTLRFLMKSNFQTIMYRMFRLGRADAALYKQALTMQAFNKETNNLFGYVIKVVLSAPDGSDLQKEPWRAIDNMLTPEEYLAALKKACQLWKDVIYIHSISI